MNLPDIAIRILFGILGVGVILYLFVFVVVPILAKIGKTIASDDTDKGFQIALGFLICAVSLVMLAAIWFVGDFLVSLIFKLK